MALQSMGMDEVTHESQEKRYGIEASDNTILKGCKGEGGSREVRGKRRVM